MFYFQVKKKCKILGLLLVVLYMYLCVIIDSSIVICNNRTLQIFLLYSRFFKRFANLITCSRKVLKWRKERKKSIWIPYWRVLARTADTIYWISYCYSSQCFWVVSLNAGSFLKRGKLTTGKWYLQIVLSF